MQIQPSRSHSTIKDVAEHAGVSIATVSRVLNKTAPVQEDTARRVFAAVETLKYRPKAAARILARQKTDTIGLLLPLISGDFFTEMLQGIERGLVEGGYSLLIHATCDGVGIYGATRHALGEHNTDGLIIFANSLTDDELHRFHEIGFPVVLLHRASPAGLHLPSVTVENKTGASTIVEHLIVVHNRRRIVFLRGPQDHEDAAWRELGYRQALERQQIPFDPDLIEVGNFNESDARQAIQRLLTRGLAFDAVFAADDDSASGALTALRAAGRRVPQDVALAGFDDSPFARTLNPPLTTINAHIQQAGYAAARQLVRLLRSGQADPITSLPTELVIRRSCGCNPSVPETSGGELKNS